MTSRYIGMHGHKQSNIIGDLPPAPGDSGIFGLVKRFENADAGDLELGDVVRLDVGGDNLVELTTTLGDPLVVGVVAGAGPYAPGDDVPVLIMGYHPAVKISGAAAPGDYLQASNTDGAGEVQFPAAAGAFARATAEDAAGTVAAIVFDASLGAGAGGPATQITETGGPTDLDIAAIPDGYFLRRVGTNVVGAVPSGAGIEYDPRRAPASPSATDDEFDDLSLAGAWTQQNSGGATRTVDETLRKGWIYIQNIDGGGGSDTGIYKAFVPGAVAFTVVVKGSSNVRDAGSNQNNLIVFDGSGNFIYEVGALNSAQFIVADTGGFRTYSISGISRSAGELWLILMRDSSTNYQAFVSPDGMQWARLEGANRSGTVGRVKLLVASFSSSNADWWVDFIRMFTSQTLVVGSAP